MNKKRTLLALAAGCILASSVALATASAGNITLAYKAQQIPQTLKNKIGNFMQSQSYYFIKGKQTPFGMMSFANSIIANSKIDTPAPNPFPGDCSVIVTVANQTAQTALATIAQFKPDPNKLVTVGQQKITTGVIEGVMTAGAAGIAANTIAINTYDQCTPQTYELMQYLDDVTVLATTALNLPLPK